MRKPLPFHGRRRHLLLLFLFFYHSISFAQTILLQTSFEDGFGVYPLNWSTGSSYPGNNWSINTINTYAYAGSKSMVCYNPYSMGSGSIPMGQLTSPAFTCDSGYSYTVRFYQRCAGSNIPVKLKVNIYGASSGPITCYNDSTLANTTFQLRTTTFQVPADGQYVLSFENYSTYINAIPYNGVYIDSVTVYKVPLPLCAGVPATGTLSAVDTTICPGDTARLALNGYPTNVDGVNRLWQTSTDNGITWQTISGVTGVDYQPIFSGAIAFRVVAICSFTGQRDTSNIVTVHPNPPLKCYCKPVYQATIAIAPPMKMMGALWLYGEQGSSFVGDLNTCFTCTSGALNYFDRTETVLPVIVYTGIPYQLQHEMNSVGYSAYMFKIWVDLDNNAVFDTNEALYYDNAYQSGQTRSMPFTIPAGTAPGMHRMRVLMLNGMTPTPDMTLTDACGTYYSGETRDFLLEVQSPTPPANDKPTGATSLPLGAGCTGNTTNGTTVLATIDSGEPLVACSNKNVPYNSVWYSFIAPASGKVRISTANGNGTLVDTKLMVYSATNPASYQTFTAIGCDDDNGGAAAFTRSLLYLARLQPGQTYYIQVARKSATAPDGTFCINADEMTESMISTSGACLYAGTNSQWGGNAWVSLVDVSGKLVSNVKTNAGYVNTLETPAYIHNGTVRSYSSKRLLDRNWSLELANPLNAPADIQLFFRRSEWNALVAAAPGITLSNAGILQLHDKSCSGTYSLANTTTTNLSNAAQDTSGGIYLVQTGTAKAGAIFISGVNTTAVHSLSSNPAGLKIYPNPATEVLNLEAADAAMMKGAAVSITDVTGRVVFGYTQLSVPAAAIKIPVASFPAGSYFVTVRKDTWVYHGTFIKK